MVKTPRALTKIFLGLSAGFITLTLVLVLSSCAQTQKGLKRDWENVKAANEWFKENYW